MFDFGLPPLTLYFVGRAFLSNESPLFSTQRRIRCGEGSRISILSVSTLLLATACNGGRRSLTGFPFDFKHCRILAAAGSSVSFSIPFSIPTKAPDSRPDQVRSWIFLAYLPARRRNLCSRAGNSSCEFIRTIFGQCKFDCDARPSSRRSLWENNVGSAVQNTRHDIFNVANKASRACGRDAALGRGLGDIRQIRLTFSRCAIRNSGELSSIHVYICKCVELNLIGQVHM